MTEATHQVVVGVDGSAASQAALRWAVDEARLRGASVTVIYAWQLPLEYGMYEGMIITDGAPEELEKAADRFAHDTVAAVVSEDESVPITVSLRHGTPSKVLAEASRDADLIVVGAEGHNAFTGMLLGSVSLHLVHHAACPITIVRPEAQTVAAAA